VDTTLFARPFARGSRVSSLALRQSLAGRTIAIKLPVESCQLPLQSNPFSRTSNIDDYIIIIEQVLTDRQLLDTHRKSSRSTMFHPKPHQNERHLQAVNRTHVRSRGEVTRP